MGVLNVSPESFHGGSVRLAGDDLLRAALAMVEAGAALIDVGARSTAPYLPTEIGEAEECDRLARAVERLAPKLPVPVSADTARPGPARAALDAGALVINDVTGLRDPGLAELVRACRFTIVLPEVAKYWTAFAAEELGIGEWVLWNPRSVYPAEALRPRREAVAITAEPGPPSPDARGR